MRAARAWRCFLELPDDSILAVQLTSQIESQVRVTITANPQGMDGGVEAIIDPAYIVDVPSKGKRFQIVIETVSEQQSSIGPTLTAMTGEPVILCIQKLGSQSEMPMVTQRGTIDEKALRGLHMTFFKNARFQDFITEKTGADTSTPDSCKSAFKRHMGVLSCTEIDQIDFDAFIREFNAWLNGGTCG